MRANKKAKEPKKVKSFWNERWQKVITKEPTNKCDYWISDYGRIKSIDKRTGVERKLKGSLMRQYNLRTLNLKLKGDIRQSFYVHRVVAQYFVKKEREDQNLIIHIDGDNLNNHWENLKWLSKDEVAAHYKAKGSYKGLPPANPKLKESEVKIIRKYLKSDKTRRKIIAKRFDISLTQLKRIETGENWGNLK